MAGAEYSLVRVRAALGIDAEADVAEALEREITRLEREGHRAGGPLFGLRAILLRLCDARCLLTQGGDTAP